MRANKTGRLDGQRKLEVILASIEKKHPFSGDKDMKAAINSIMDKEIKKPGNKADCALIDECIDALLSLDGYDAENFGLQADETADKTIEKLYARRTRNRERSRPSFGKPLAVVLAACFLMILVIVPTTVNADSFNSYTVASKIVGFLFNLKPGETISIGKFSFTKPKENEYYSDIEEAMKAEKLDIMYPFWLPEGVYVKSISKLYWTGENWTLILNLSSNKVSFAIENTDKNDPSIYEDAEILTYNNVDFYVIEEQGKYYAKCNCGGYKYAIMSADYDTLIKILQNMKGLN